MPSVREIASRFGAPRVRFSFTSSSNSSSSASPAGQTTVAGHPADDTPILDPIESSNSRNPEPTDTPSPTSPIMQAPPSPTAGPFVGAAGASSAAAVHEPVVIQQRRASATQAMAQRRASAIQMILQESRGQEERPEEGRHAKRRSTNNLNFQPEQQAELEREYALAAGNRDGAVAPPNVIADEEEKQPETRPTAPAPSTNSGRPPLAPPRATSHAAAAVAPVPTPRHNNTAAVSSSTAAPQRQSTPPVFAATSTNPTPVVAATAAAAIASAAPASATTENDRDEKLSATIPIPAANLDSLPQLSKDIVSGIPEKELMATISIRTMLSQNVDWIQTIVSTPNIVSKLVAFLDRDNERRLQFEATWSLTNIASGTSAHTQLVVRAGALPSLIRLLDSSSVEIREQAVWALGNIAGDSPELRDEVIGHGIVPILTRRLDAELSLPARKQHPSLMRNAVWTIANLCRGKPPPPFGKVRAVIPVLGRAIETSDPEMQADACWALNYLGDGDHERIQALVDAGVCSRLVELMEHSAQTVKTPALRAVGNVVTGDDAQTEHILNLGALNKLRTLLVDPRHTIRGEACWTISNITAGNHMQIQKVMNADVFPRLVECAKDVETYVAKEAVWAITNATSGGTTDQVVTLGRQGCIQGLVAALQNAEELNNRVVVVALEGISNFLTAADVRDPSNNEFAQILKDCGGERLLREDLVHHVNDDVREKAKEIITRYLDFQQQQQQIKPPPEMWTPEEVLEQKKKQQAEVEAAKKREEEEAAAAAGAGQATRNRRGSAFVPPQFFCPISQELMMDPVSTVDGHVYDRINIQRWFNTGKNTSPVTGQPLASTILVPNHPLRQMIESYRPGHTHRADLDTEWQCVACTMKNKPTDMMCLTCGAEKPPRAVKDPDAIPASKLLSGDF